MEGTSQTPTISAPQASVTPTAPVANVAQQYATSSPSPYQASAPQAAPVAQPSAYQPAVAPQASATPAAQANPWQEAFQALSASLNTPSQSQAQVPYSAYQTPTNQVSTQAQWDSRIPTTPQAYQAQPTYAPQVSTQELSAQAQQQMLAQHQQAMLAQAQQAALAQQEASASVSDAYLNGISDVSLEVLEHFGAEAPALLNQYACAVEDALIEQVQRGQHMHLMLDAAGEERAAMNIMLTDPDVLADYVNDFFGPNGPYPTETNEERYYREALEQETAMEQELYDYEHNYQVPASFQRPQMDMPVPGQQASQAATNFWGDFNQLMDSNPEDAWKYLSAAPGAAFQSKMLVQDA